MTTLNIAAIVYNFCGLCVVDLELTNSQIRQCFERRIIVLSKEMDDKVISPEKAEEAKLKARYPNLGTKPGGSDLLRKRLQKGVWFIRNS